MQSKRAFTLVELLVVIGIIAVLISLLLPALGRARRQAMTVKCATQLREVGNAMLLYASDNKGYLPAPRIFTKYQIDGLTYNVAGSEVVGSVVAENAKWWNFIGKYLTKSTTMAQQATDINAMKSAAYWCPQFDGFTDSGSAVNLIGGTNRNATGFGMNWWPNFTAADPGPFNGNGFPSGTRQVERFSDPTGGNTSGSGPAQGTWYKLTQFHLPASRALLGDARQFYLEARMVPTGQSIPGQRLNLINSDYSSGTVGARQTTFDFYRHGTYPSVADGTPTTGYYQPSGGKVAYNILFADGHAETESDRETGYNALRQRFPN